MREPVSTRIDKGTISAITLVEVGTLAMAFALVTPEGSCAEMKPLQTSDQNRQQRRR